MPKSSIHKLCVTVLHEAYFFFLMAQQLHTPVDSVHAPATVLAGFKIPVLNSYKVISRLTHCLSRKSTDKTLKYQRIRISFLSSFTRSGVWSINESHLSGQAFWWLLPLFSNLYYFWNSCNEPLSHRLTTLCFLKMI